MGYVAIDLGASSGRAIWGEIKANKLQLQEVYRFQNAPREQGKRLVWDFDILLSHIKKGIKAAYHLDPHLKGIAVDTWGVDYGLLSSSGALLSNPYCYRDSATQGYVEKTEDKISSREFYASTGIQQMNINSVYQLLSQKENNCSAFKEAKSLLFMPDLINYFLTGKKATEYTIASTSQLMNAQSKNWDTTLFDKLGLPLSLMSEICLPGTLLNPLTPQVAKELNIPQLPVYLVGSHDTASAIAAIPQSEHEHAAFLSSGTWSLLGITTPTPFLTDDALKANFTNEGGVNNKILFMRNITGLWLLQQLIESWKKEPGFTVDYDSLLDLMEHTKPFKCIIDSDHPSFNFPESMPTAIQEYCRSTHQPQPESKGEFVRCVLESLALKYALVKEKLEYCTSTPIKTLHIVGGGSLNRHLNQFIANALEVEVYTGITEGTAIGNILQQAIASGELANWTEAHKIVKNTYPFEKYQPREQQSWADAKEKLRSIVCNY